MDKMRKRWGRKVGLLFWGLAGAGLAAFLTLTVLGRLDRDDPWVNLKPQAEVVGAKAAFLLEATDQSSGLKEVRVIFTQGPQEKVVLARAFPPGGDPGARVELPFTLEPQAWGFQDGKATLTLKARDRSWRDGFKGRTATLTQEVTVDLVPLTLTFLSVSHLLRPGGTGLICYRLNKTPRESGVMSGGFLYLGYPNPQGGQGEYVCLFPVPQEASGSAQVELVARPPLGSEVRQRLALKLKPRRWRQDRLNLSDDFLRRVAASFALANPGDPLSPYLEVNRDLRRKNHEQVRRVCGQGQPQPLWSGAFQRFLGKPMARFGDRRTYIYQGRQVDQQVHLGEDLASLEHSPVAAGNHGVVVFTEPLGIYGQTVILDHGLGVFSMYSHLSKIGVKPGDRVEKGAILGRTGVTGLAGGDHLHFAMILQGEFVDPVEWWDPHWLKDQVEGLWARSGAPPPEVAKAAVSTPKTGKDKPKPGKSKAKSAKSQKRQ